MSMIKIFIAFVVFAALAMFMLMKGGDIDMSGEKHGSEATHSEPAKPETPAAPAAGAASKP
jgi:hypothetical protein